MSAQVTVTDIPSTTIRTTKITRDGEEFIVNTADLEGLAGPEATFVWLTDDIMGQSGMGRYEVMLSWHDHWWNFSKGNFATKEEAQTYHDELVQTIRDGRIGQTWGNSIEPDDLLWDLDKFKAARTQARRKAPP